MPDGLQPCDVDPAIDLLVELTRRLQQTRLAMTKTQAAEALTMSVDSFERYVMPEVRCVRRGRLRLFPVTELERWLHENAEPLFKPQAP